MSRNPTFSPDAPGSGMPVPTAKPPNAFKPAGPGASPAPGPTPPPAAVPASPPAAPAGSPPESAQATKIKAFEQRLGAGMQTEAWKRTPNVTGQGASHVKSFHCKLSADALEFLDKQINDWLEAHPDYEVKLVTTTVGDWTGKIKEPAMIVQVWV